MKRILCIFVMYLMFFSQWAVASVTGEFIVEAPTGVTVNATLSSSIGYGWDGTNVTYISSYSHTYAAWHGPKVGTPYMPWGLMLITIYNYGTQIFQFTLDFRDINWSTNADSYPGADTHLVITSVNPPACMLTYNDGLELPLTSGRSYTIWGVWGATQDNSLFGTPVFVQNQYHSGEAGGSLEVGADNVNSGQYGITPNQPTCAIGTNNERFIVNVGGSNDYRKHHDWNGSNSDYLLSRTVAVPSSPFQEIANFISLSAATIQATLVDNGSNLDNIQFRDPWYVESNGTQPNSFDTFTSPFHPTGANGQSGGGVFLGQTVNLGTYYSVQSPTTKNISGYSAFFTGWSSTNATLSQVGSNPTGFDQKAVVFTNSNATVTANYSYSTVSTSVTIPSGTYNVAGSLTINSGATLTLRSGVTMNFPSGASLVVNGALVANGTTFNFVQSQSSPYTTGISMNSNGSSLVNCTISGADEPLVITNVSTATINSCIINNSAFSGTQAIYVINSTPNIVNVQINGQSGSSNGVRYTNGGGGTLNETTIQNLGAGNGIVIQGSPNPTPTISNCFINNNYYYGIILIGPTTGVPLISGNQFSGNGTHGSTKQYFNLYFSSYSWGTVQSNYITGSLVGVGSYGGSSVTAGSGQNGLNTITGNSYNLICRGSGSSMGFGSYSGRYYSGTCNNIYGGTLYDAYADGGATIEAEYNWWNQSPPNWNKIYYVPGSYIDTLNWLTSQGGCPGGGGDVIVQGGSSATTSVDSSGSASQLYQRATNAFLIQDYATSSSLCQFILKSNASVADKQRAMVRLLSVLLQSGDTTIVSELKSFMVGTDSLSQTAEELLANAYTATGKTSNAVSLANDLISKNPGTEIEKRALLLLASLRAYDKSAESISAQALQDVKAKYGSSLDQGMMAALTTANDVAAVSLSPNKSVAQKAKGEAKVENANGPVTEYGIENYPNPFNPTTTIAYQLPKDGKVTIKIYDAIGRVVTTLVDEFKPSGRYSVQFDASRLASGIYFYSIRSGNYNAVKKMLLLK